jgi:hypothetical protein
MRFVLSFRSSSPVGPPRPGPQIEIARRIAGRRLDEIARRHPPPPPSPTTGGRLDPRTRSPTGTPPSPPPEPACQRADPDSVTRTGTYSSAWPTHHARA